MKLAITGGTGFVGRHLINLAVARKHEVRALTRTPQLHAGRGVGRGCDRSGAKS